MTDKPFKRDLVHTLVSRLREPRRFMQVVMGPRQTGKTTAVTQALDELKLKRHFALASVGSESSQDWLRAQWEQARILASQNPQQPVLLILDEVQLVSQWSGVVKALWDEDTLNNVNIRVVLSGSSALLLQQGLREALTGRFELIHSQQWDFSECQAAFGLTLDEYLFYGGYPGALPLREDRQRWLDYMRNSIIGPSVLRDAVATRGITKPALMESLFALGAAYSAQELSYRKIMGQLDDAGNATTIAHYLQALSDAGLLTGIQKYTGNPLRTRSSSPRLLVHDTALMVAESGTARSRLLDDPVLRGHLVESAVGAYLLRRGTREGFTVNWWRDKHGNEVDFVISDAHSHTAIEVKSGRIRRTGGLSAFAAAFPETKTLVIGSAASPLEDFLSGKIDLFA